MMGKKVVGYIRVSTEGQVRDGYSLAYQVEEIERYCNENNLELLRAWKLQNPNEKASKEDYRQAALNSGAFAYEGI